MKHFGDITKLNGAEVPVVDVICGGSPCQDLSVAGKRAGLAGERSGLFMDQIRIIKEMRDECERRLYDAGADYNRTDIKPRYMVWENVAGAFSSNKGEDFRAVLEETAKVADKDAYVPGLEGGARWSPTGCILGNGWSIAWRLHDAQYWGVPQRRKRICLLADFNGDTAGKVLFELQRETTNRDTEQAIVDIGAESRSEVQSVSKGLSGDIAQSGKEGESVTEDTERCTGEASYTLKVRGGAEFDRYGKRAGKGALVQTELSGTLDLNGGNPGCNQGGMAVVCIEGNGQRESHKGDGYKESDTMYTLNTVEQHAVCIENHPADSRVKIEEDGVCQTLSGRMETGGGNVPMVMETYQETTGSLCASGYDKLGTQEAANDMFVVQSSWDDSQVSPTLMANNANGSQRMPDIYNFNAVISAEVYHCTSENDKVQTLQARDYKDPQVVAYGLDRASYNQGQNAQYNFSVDEEKVETCVAKGPNAVCKAIDCLNGRKKDVNGTLAANACKSINSGNVVRCESVVRRLTPMECERLQGFPDNWTNIGDWVDSKGKTHKGESDSPRYKALGNSIALPFWQWMAERMMPYLPENPTMASLFDGIGGFPLVFSRCGCKPVWASEIEEFPIAITKIRFPEK